MKKKKKKQKGPLPAEFVSVPKRITLVLQFGVENTTP